MARSVTKNLYLQIGGDVTSLVGAAKAGKSALVAIGTAAVDVQADVDRAFADLGANAPAKAKLLERSYAATFDAIRQNARAVLDAPSAGAAFQILDHGAAEQTAVAAERVAAELRQVATAAAAVATRAGEAGAAERVLAVAAAANATQAEQEAVALRNQATVLGAVRGELQAMGVAQDKNVVVNGQAKAGYQQLSYQLGDVATQYASGASASIIFAQQSGQVIQAIQLIAGESKGFIGFLGGPWGIALSSALVLLTPFAGKLLEGRDALAKETDSLKENAEKAGIADQAKRAFAITEAGVHDDVRQLTEELKKQNDALRTNAELLNIRAKKDLAAAQKNRPQLVSEVKKAERDLAITRAAPRGEGDGSGDAAAAAAELRASTRLDSARAALAANGRTIAAAEAARLASQRDLAAESAQRQADPLEQIKRRYEGPDGLIEQAKRHASAEEVVNGILTRRLFNLAREQKAETELARKRIEAAKQTGNDNQIGRTIDVAEATRIAANIGGRVTSGLRSTDKQAQLYADKLAGRHGGPVARPGTSDHERGQAIDIAYGPGISVTSIRKAFAKEGVAIRQLLDERDQKVFHVAFGPKGKSQETIDRQDEADRQKKVRDDEAYAQLRARADQELIDGKRAQVTSVTEAARLDAAAVEIERARLDSVADAGVAEKRWSQAKADELKALNKASADLKVAAIDERRRLQLAADALQVTRDDLEGENALLSIQADLTVSAQERRRIGLKILANEERLARATLETAIGAEKDPAKRADLERQLGRVGEAFSGRRSQLERQTDDPLQAYGRRLIDATSNMDEAFKGVKADGLHELEDGLVGVISGTESVAGAFKRMASAIIADLARIAVQKLIVGALGKSFFGFADGGLVQAHADGGLISGAGTGTSDDILSWLSNGEFVITAAATRRHLPLLRAINDNRLPAFATGGLVGSMALPRLPDVRRAANDVYAARPQRVAVDVNATIAASEDFEVRMQGVAARTVGAAAEPIIAGATSATMRRLRRSSLPGGLAG